MNIAPPSTPLLQWTPNDVHTWVLSGGFAPIVATAFRQNELKGADLSSLTDFELEVDLGVSSVDVRCRLLRTIKALVTQSQATVAAVSHSDAPKPELEAFLESAAAKARSEQQAAEAEEDARAHEEEEEVEEKNRVMKIHLEKDDPLLESIGIRSFFKAILLQCTDSLLDVRTLLLTRLSFGMKEQQAALVVSSLQSFQLFYVDNGTSCFFSDTGPIWPVVKEKELTVLHFRQSARCSGAITTAPSTKLILRVYLEDSQPTIRNLQLGNTVKAIVLSQGMRVENLLAMTANRVTRGLDQVRTDFVNKALADHKLYFLNNDKKMEQLIDSGEDLYSRFSSGNAPLQLYLRSPANSTSLPTTKAAEAPTKPSTPSKEPTPKKIIKVLLESTDAVIRNLGIDNTAKAVFVEPKSTVDDLLQQLIDRITRGMTPAQSQMVKQATINHRLYYLQDEQPRSLAEATADSSIWEAIEKELVPLQLVFRLGQEHVQKILGNRQRPASVILTSPTTMLGRPPASTSAAIRANTPPRPPALTSPPTIPSLPPLPPPTASLPPPPSSPTPLPPPIAALPPPPIAVLPPTTTTTPASVVFDAPLTASASSSSIPSSRPAPKRVQSMFISASSGDLTQPEKIIIKAILLPSLDEELVRLGISNTRKALIIEPKTSLVALFSQLIKNLTKGLDPQQTMYVATKFESYRFFFLSGSHYERVSGCSPIFDQLAAGTLANELYVLEAPGRFYLEPNTKPVSSWLGRDIADWFVSQHCPPDIAEKFVEQGLCGSDLDGLTATEFEEDLLVTDSKMVQFLMDGIVYLMNPEPEKKLIVAVPVQQESPLPVDSSLKRSGSGTIKRSASGTKSKRLSFFGGKS